MENESTATGRQRRPRRLRRRTAGALVAVSMLVVATAASVLSGGIASAAVGSPLVSAASGRCLDVMGNSTANGAGLEIWDCNGQQNQGWVFTSAGELRTFNESKCLDVPAGATTSGTLLAIWDCNGGANQRFQRNGNAIVATQSGLCLDVVNANTANGSRINLWGCSGQSNQQWTTSGGTPTSSPSAPGGGTTTCNVAPVDSQATTQAKKLLCYLYSQYGNHIISGQQESTWVSGPDYEMNYIRNISGKYPAIRGQDMGDAPDFGSRGLAWWNAGGIPMVGYHMGAPNQNTDGYAGSQLTANINAALSSGTADNTRLNQRLTGLANQLKIIQNGGGAVILRPWHEAPGTWFWWSKEGAGQYNRLWIYTFNYLRSLGVHNAVWLHPFNGSPSSAWYPGKQYVDIGGADTYAGDHNPLTSMYNTCVSIYGSSMPIALHENGPIPDPAQLQSARSRWVLFNTWHTTWITNTSTNPTSLINSVYNSSYVVTRDEVPSLR